MLLQKASYWGLFSVTALVIALGLVMAVWLREPRYTLRHERLRGPG
jgi:hypothetical protein